MTKFMRTGSRVYITRKKCPMYTTHFVRIKVVLILDSGAPKSDQILNMDVGNGNSNPLGLYACVLAIYQIICRALSL